MWKAWRGRRKEGGMVHKTLARFLPGLAPIPLPLFAPHPTYTSKTRLSACLHRLSKIYPSLAPPHLYTYAPRRFSRFVARSRGRCTTRSSTFVTHHSRGRFQVITKLGRACPVPYQGGRRRAPLPRTRPGSRCQSPAQAHVPSPLPRRTCTRSTAANVHAPPSPFPGAYAQRPEEEEEDGCGYGCVRADARVEWGLQREAEEGRGGKGGRRERAHVQRRSGRTCGGEAVGGTQEAGGDACIEPAGRSARAVAVKEGVRARGYRREVWLQSMLVQSRDSGHVFHARRRRREGGGYPVCSAGHGWFEGGIWGMLQIQATRTEIFLLADASAKLIVQSIWPSGSESSQATLRLRSEDACFASFQVSSRQCLSLALLREWAIGDVFCACSIENVVGLLHFVHAWLAVRTRGLRLLSCPLGRWKKRKK
ncbi:hypothetical protein C8R44DRAFT_330395 [Mycena epipterygia]|nr:hypothetical protein C8R44DRAFT_330395 [Mycena epipterygia]